MNPAIYSSLMLLLLVLIITGIQMNRTMIAGVITKRKKRQLKGLKGEIDLNELLEKFLGKKCYIHSLQGEPVLGVISEIKDQWITVTVENGTVQLINSDYVTKVCEKKEKKKKQ